MLLRRLNERTQWDKKEMHLLPWYSFPVTTFGKGWCCPAVIWNYRSDEYWSLGVILDIFSLLLSCWFAKHLCWENYQIHLTNAFKPITFNSTNTVTTFSHTSHLLTNDKDNILLIPIHISPLYAFYRIYMYMWT